MMRIAMVAALVLLSQAGAALTGEKESAKLKGRWAMATLIHDDKNLSENLKLVFVFDGNHAVIEGNDNVKKAYLKLVFTLDPSTKPPIVDIVVAEGGQKDT